jgi:hypothetical protein
MQLVPDDPVTVHRQVVPDDDVARLELGQKDLPHVRTQRKTVHRASKYERCLDAGQFQRGNKRGCGFRAIVDT